jgi:polysaccharide biosynthesis protein VpsM
MRLSQSLLAISILAAIGSLAAQNPSAPNSSNSGNAPQMATQGNGVPFGPMTLFPSIGISASHDSNVARTNTNKIDSFVTNIAPAVRLVGSGSVTTVSLQYQGDIGRFADSSIDNYDDHSFAAQVNYAPTSRVSVGATASYQLGHDSRGTGAREGTQLALRPLRPDEWKRRGVVGNLGYGADGARGRVEAQAGTSTIDYDEVRIADGFSRAQVCAPVGGLDPCDYARFRDHQTTFVDGTVLIRVAPKTSALLSIGQRSFDYEVDPSAARGGSLDSTERSYYLGLQWEATARTTGTAKIGRVKKDFDSNREDFTGTVYELGATWAPRSYSTVQVTGSRNTRETNGFGDFVVSRLLSAGWSHEWTPRISSSVDGGFGNNQTKGSIGFTRPERRDEDFTFFGVSGRYQIADWLQVGAGYKYFSNDSNDARLATDPSFEYDRSQFILSLEGSL